MKSVPVRRDGYETRARLLHVAREAFEERGYHRTSIAEICRRASVANGTFYRYFSSKDEVFLHLAERLAAGLEGAIADALSRSEDVFDQIHGTLTAFYDYVDRHRALYQIFREAEFVRLELPLNTYHRLARRLADRLFGEAGASPDGVPPSAVSGKPLVPEPARFAATFAVIGCASMLAAKYILWEQTSVPPDVVASVADFLTRGLSGPAPLPPLPRQAIGVLAAAGGADKPEPADDGYDLDAAGVTEGQRTRRKLLRAAEHCFAETGFFRAQIADITRKAGVAQGTFYVHFPSKTDILRELVRDINRRLRAAIRRGLAEAGLGPDADRRHAEIVGLASFLRWLRYRRGIYRIVREAEFVDEEVARWYYDRLGAGYARALRAATSAGQVRPLPEQPLAYCLLGVGHISGVRWVLWPARQGAGEADLRGTVRVLATLILHGVEGLRDGHAGVFTDVHR